MRIQLQKNPALLLTYFNVMILSKAFKLNRTLIHQNSSSCPPLNCCGLQQQLSVVANDSVDVDDVASRTTTTTRPLPILSNIGGEYDADAELSVQDDLDNDNDNTTVDDTGEDGENTADESNPKSPRNQTRELNNQSNYKYDLILFPKILDICLSYIVGVKKRQYAEMREILEKCDGVEARNERLEQFAQKYERFDRATHAYLKRVVYLLETCTFNVQILVYNNYRNHFIDLIAQKPLTMLATSQEFEKVLKRI